MAMEQQQGVESSINPSTNGANSDNAESSREKHGHRHTPEQIHRLEVFYKDNPHPDEKQKLLLSQQLGLEVKQIKFWFQNKRTHAKASMEKAEINAIRRDNDRLHGENVAMEEALKGVICGDCKIRQSEGEQGKKRRIERLKKENEELQEEAERLETMLAYLSGNDQPGQDQLPGVRIGEHHNNQNSNLLAHNTKKVSEMMLPPGCIDRKIERRMTEIATKAMEELLELVRADETLWISSPSDPQTLVIHRESYNNRFPKPKSLISGSTRFESSKDSAVVALSAEDIAKLFMLPVDWVDLFPTIITKTKTWRITESEKLKGSLHMMYEQMQTFSPLVAPREFRLLRNIIQLQPAGCWIVADVSVDYFRIGLEQPSPPYSCWRLPSGCLIENLPSTGYSKVTWVEHVEVDNKTSLTDHSHLFGDFVSTSKAYGAKLWISSLGRNCERLAYATGLMTPIHRHELEEVINLPESRRGTIELANQMVKEFYVMLSTMDKVNCPQPSHMMNMMNREFWFSSNPVDPSGVLPSAGTIVKAAVTVWLPLPCPTLFTFFTNERMRSKWDLSNGNPVNEISHISCGSHPGNCVSILHPFVPDHQLQNMDSYILQESSIDPSGAYIIHSPVSMKSLRVAFGEEVDTSISTSSVSALQPSGVTITPSTGSSSRNIYQQVVGSSSSSTSNSLQLQTPNGSLVTLTMQLVMPSITITHQHGLEECIATTTSLLSSSIENIKLAFNLYM